MYINRIDNLLDETIEEFSSYIFSNKEIDKYIKEINFIKYQLEINNIFINFVKNINKKKINNILNDEDHTNKIIEIIKKYMAFYVFMLFGFYYSGKTETFINNVIEFSKNQPSYNFKVDNFFNSESNSQVIKYYTLIQSVKEILNSSEKSSQLSKKPEMEYARRFLNEIGQEYVNSFLKLKNLEGGVKQQAHNIIKLLIINDLYINKDKIIINEFIEERDAETGEFIYIDIVIPKTEYIDYNSIELSLSQKDIDNGLVAEIYDLITQAEKIKVKDKGHDEKILELLNSKLVIPVSEDFLLYHKDSEKYQKVSGALNQSTHTKKKDDTKIKYIVSKIDNVSEYFSKNVKDNKNLKTEIEKLFYTPMADRRAVTVNNIEDINILNKFENQGRRAIENNEYYADLLNYRQYPYINFKDIQNYGFTITNNKTLDVIRSINFDLSRNQYNKNRLTDFRVTNAGNSITIVGFIISPQIDDIKCSKIKDFIDIRKVGTSDKKNIKKSENGYNNSLKLIKNIINKPSKRRPPIYWMFDLDKDKVVIEKYDVEDKNNINEQTKIVISSFYNDIINVFYDKVLNYIEKNKVITLQKFYQLIDNIDKKYILFSENEIFIDLLKTIHDNKIVTTKLQYDKKEDQFPGLSENLIKLPSIKIEKQKKIETIRLIKSLDETLKPDVEEEDESTIQYDVICQHNITWDNIMALRKKNPNQFDEKIYDFFLQYVDQNHEGLYICKSCKSELNMKNYVLDGTYDDDGSFVITSRAMNVPLEDIPEYEKYKPTIKNLEKIIERIASITNINTLNGSSNKIKSRISKIVKDAIDLILVHNASMKNIYKERTEKIVKYGLNKEYSDLFNFELDNSIFVYSSKDKDYFKQIKRNNIWIYIIYLIIMELSDTQLLYLTSSKICNHYYFSKYGINLFKNIYILKNNSSVAVPILEYELFCYIIFYMSCMMTRYNLWQRQDTDASKDKFDLNVQKKIIHTLIDFMNSIVEINSQKKKKYIYDIISTRYFTKLNTTYSNNTILEKIKALENKNIVVEDNKVKMISVRLKPKLLDNQYNEGTYFEINKWRSCKCAKNYIRIGDNLFEKYVNISNITNCESGPFHDWCVKDKNLVCLNCNITTKDFDTSLKMTQKILDNYLKQKIVRKTCSNDKRTAVVYVKESQKSFTCLPCSYIEIEAAKKSTDEYSKEFEKIKEKLTESSSTENVKDIVNTIKADYGQSKRHKEDYFYFIDNFVKNLESILGKDVNIGNQNIYLRTDSYIIDHDHNGYIIEKPYYIKDDGDKIIYKKNHPFFKQDVIFYTNNRLQIDVFYDPLTKLLLGFKEKNKEYSYPKMKNVYLKSKKSVMSMLKLLGYPSQYIDIENKMKEYNQIYKEEFSLIQTISDISRNRIKNLKKVITDLQRYINRAKYNFDEELLDTENNLDVFLNKYKNKLNNLINSSNNFEFLESWDKVRENIYFENIRNKAINISPDVKYLNFEEIANYDYSGNVLLYYIVNNLNDLIKINDDKYVKLNLSYFLIDVILREYNQFNIEDEMTNSETRRFKYILTVKSDRDVDALADESEFAYEEYTDPDEEMSDEAKEKLYDAQQEEQAIDVEDDELDYEIDYEPGVNISG